METESAHANSFKSRLRDIKRQRAANESIRTLLSVVQYLNQVQDGDAVRIDQTYCKTEMEKRCRILNCHEEDIMNASLITMKRLIETLLPEPCQTGKSSRPSITEEPLVQTAELD